MRQQVIIEITADVPEDHQDLGHEAVVATKAPAQAIIDALTALGLVNVRADRRIGRIRGPKAAKADTTPAMEPVP